MNAFFKSFIYAFKGLFDLFRHHRNGQFHLVAALVSIGLGFFFAVSAGEWTTILLCIGVVTALEGMNTAIEYLTDMVSPEHHPMAGKVKDMAAGAVLFAAVCAGVIGAVIFLPKIADWCSNG